MYTLGNEPTESESLGESLSSVPCRAFSNDAQASLLSPSPSLSLCQQCSLAVTD